MPDIVSVVVPVLNGVSKIRASINSALNQAGNFGIRLHVQDGGSSDGTVELVESIARGISNGEIGCDADRVHFSFSSESDTGLYHALRRGFAELDVPGSSPLTWINAGDYFLPGAFQCASQIFAAESSVRWIVPPIHVVAEGQLVRALRMQYPRTVVAAGMCDGLNWPTIQQEGSFWRREVWDRDCQAIEGFQLAGDWALWREFANAETPFHVTRPLAAFCVSEGQLSSSSKRYQREIRRHRSDREVAVAFESCVECCMGLRVPVIDENCGIRYESLAIERFLESGARERLIRAMAGRLNLVTGDDATANAGLQPFEGDRLEHRSAPYLAARGLYRRLPEQVRMRLQPAMRRIFGR